MDFQTKSNKKSSLTVIPIDRPDKGATQLLLQYVLELLLNAAGIVVGDPVVALAGVGHLRLIVPVLRPTTSLQLLADVVVVAASVPALMALGAHLVVIAVVQLVALSVKGQAKEQLLWVSAVL